MELILPNWQAPDNVKAFTSTRLNGYSKSPYGSLNVGDHVGDEPQIVEKNRAKLINEVEHIFDVNVDVLSESRSKLESKPQFVPRWLNQAHTTFISTDEKPINCSPCDGQFTRTKELVCTIMTADCLPVFICNKAGTEIALVHAGWRGLANGIVESALQLFSDKSNDLLVYCGPAITQKNFEIGMEVKEQLGGSDSLYANNSQKKDYCYADLIGLLEERVARLGAQFTHSGLCTYADEKRFYSYRREGITGRMVSMLWLV